MNNGTKIASTTLSSLSLIATAGIGVSGNAMASSPNTSPPSIMKPADNTRCLTPADCNLGGPSPSNLSKAQKACWSKAAQAGLLSAGGVIVRSGPDLPAAFSLGTFTFGGTLFFCYLK